MKKNIELLLGLEFQLEDFYAVSFYRHNEVKLQGDITQSKFRRYKELGFEFTAEPEKNGWFSSSKMFGDIKVEITFSLQ